MNSAQLIDRSRTLGLLIAVNGPSLKLHIPEDIDQDTRQEILTGIRDHKAEILRQLSALEWFDDELEGRTGWPPNWCEAGRKLAGILHERHGFTESDARKRSALDCGIICTDDPSEHTASTADVLGRLVARYPPSAGP